MKHFTLYITAVTVYCTCDFEQHTKVIFLCMLFVLGIYEHTEVLQLAVLLRASLVVLRVH